MANKDRNKRSVRKARAEERARVEAAQAASGASQEKKGSKPLSAVLKKSEGKTEKAAEKRAEKKAPGFLGKVTGYLGDVRSEMRRVVWPSKGEVKSYAVSVIAMLIVFGVILWLVDSGIVAALVGYTGLRG